MTRTLVVLVILYLAWRVATVLGRRREREQRDLFQKFSGTASRFPALERCDRCGDYRSPLELRLVRRWPSRRVCADGCTQRVRP